MNKLFIGATAAFALIGASVASAQTTTTTTTTVEIQPEVRTQVREYIVTQERPSVALPGETVLEIGAPIPQEIELYTVEDVPDAAQYRYVIVDDRPVLVDADTREVIYIYE